MGKPADHRSSELPKGPTAPASARRLIAGSLSDRTVESVIVTAQLLVSELVTNSLQHTETEEPVGVEIDVDEDTIRVEVKDAGHGQVRMAAPTDGFEPHGHGLRLVDALSRDWGTSTGAGNTVVWFELGLGDDS